MAQMDSKTPKGSLSEKWTNHKSNINLVSPANKRLIDVIVIGTGLAGGSAAASLAPASTDAQNGLPAPGPFVLSIIVF